jgi:hypothetical protein
MTAGGRPTGHGAVTLSRVLGCVAAVALVGGGNAVAGRASDPVKPGCYVGHTYPAGDAHRVYAIPRGCTWILRPDGHYWSIGPEIHTRINGVSDGAALPRDPLGDAAAACGYSSFVVSWPRFFVTSRRVFWGNGATGCEMLPNGQAVRWEGRYVWRPRSGLRQARWEPVLVRSSAPLMRTTP